MLYRPFITQQVDAVSGDPVVLLENRRIFVDFNYGTNTTSSTLSFATSPSEGELLIWAAGTDSSGFTYTFPSGWTQLTLPTNSSNHLSVFYKLAGPSESNSVSVTISASNSNTRWIGSRIGNVDQTTPIHSVYGNRWTSGSSRKVSTVSQTDSTAVDVSVAANSMLLCFIFWTQLVSAASIGLSSIALTGDFWYHGDSGGFVFNSANQRFMKTTNVFESAQSGINSTLASSNNIGGQTALIYIRGAY